MVVASEFRAAFNSSVLLAWSAVALDASAKDLICLLYSVRKAFKLASFSTYWASEVLPSFLASACAFFISSMAFFNSWADFTTSSMSMSNSANLMFSPAISQEVLEVLTKSFQKDCHKLSVNKPLMLNSGHLPTLLLRHCLNAMVFPLPQRLQRAY